MVTPGAPAVVAASLVPSLTDLDALALTVWAEARAESLEGQAAVAQVVLNRVAAGRWGRTVRSVVSARLQFSCWWPTGGRANHDRLLGLARQVLDGQAPKSLATARWVAHGVMSGALADQVRGATHYLTAELLASGKAPAWARTMVVTARVGGHVFGRPAGE